MVTWWTTTFHSGRAYLFGSDQSLKLTEKVESSSDSDDNVTTISIKRQLTADLLGKADNTLNRRKYLNEVERICRLRAIACFEMRRKESVQLELRKS